MLSMRTKSATAEKYWLLGMLFCWLALGACYSVLYPDSYFVKHSMALYETRQRHIPIHNIEVRQKQDVLTFCIGAFAEPKRYLYYEFSANARKLVFYHQTLDEKRLIYNARWLEIPIEYRVPRCVTTDAPTLAITRMDSYEELKAMPPVTTPLVFRTPAPEAAQNDVEVAGHNGMTIKLYKHAVHIGSVAYQIDLIAADYLGLAGSMLKDIAYFPLFVILTTGIGIFLALGGRFH
jgi:hypothetical protein